MFVSILYMEYTVSKTKRNLIIFSAVFLILKNIALVAFALIFPTSDHENSIWILNFLERIIQVIPYGYIMIMLADYFRHYQLKLLQLFTIGILALEIAGSAIHYFNHPEMNVPKPLLIGNGVIWILAMIVWIIILFRVSNTNFDALYSIRKYAISVLSVIFLSGTLPFIAGKITDIQPYLGIVVALIGVFPYIFIIEFGLKLPLKE